MADEPSPEAVEGVVRVAVCQIPLVIGDTAANREVATAAILEAVRARADVVVLPELANSGYVFHDASEALQLAEPIPGETTEAWERLARDHHLLVVGGLCEIDSRGALRNSAVMVDEDGVRAVYRKVHLYGSEKEVFVPGDEAPPTVETTFGRLSMMICYDVEFPEWVRLPAIAGADLICLPVNWPRLGPDPGPFPAEVLRVLANANMNMTHIAVAARLGAERGVDWIGGSGVASPSGAWLAAMTDSPAVLIAEIDIAGDRLRVDEFGANPLADRRPELYGAIAAPRGDV